MLFAGQSYYHAWYLSRALRKLGLAGRRPQLGPRTRGTELLSTARTIESRTTRRAARVDPAPPRASICASLAALRHLPLLQHARPALRPRAARCVAEPSVRSAEIELLRRLGKKIVYSNNGCLDGVAQSSFAAWGDRPVCATARGASARTSAATSATSRGASPQPPRRLPVHIPAATARTTTTTPPSTRCRVLLPGPGRLAPGPRRARPLPAGPAGEHGASIYHAVGNFEHRTDARSQHQVHATSTCR